MKKLIVCMVALLFVCLGVVVVTANWETPAKRGSDSVKPVEEYTVKYVYCSAVYTELVADSRDEYGVRPGSDYEPTVYDASVETLPEAFSQLEFDENTTKPEYIDALYGALEAYLPEELVLSDFMIAVESTVVTPLKKTSFIGFASYADHTAASEISYSFAFTLAIGMVPSEASATVEIKNGRVTKVTIDDMERFLPYLNLSFDREHLESLINSVDNNWGSHEFDVIRSAALATSDDALYLVIHNLITDHMYDSVEDAPLVELYVFDSAYGEDVYEIRYVYDPPSREMIREYYVKLATLN